ncbi:unnamed protein product [Cylicocyclus nassatus]|uniref:RING-type domain-containing protein n=1 Tax=Cylicocyclus nassatus TaxID=53992 RepID=A0AA36HEB2_CYLNA|nr:unnamed protein product [Cylicocyclus nassatus]
MIEIRGKCVICTQRFLTHNISALHCGHIFHYDCIMQWLRCSLTCPTCRAFCDTSQIVNHLFFDDPDEHNDSSLLASPTSQRLHFAEEAIRELKNSLHRKEEEVRYLKDSHALAKIMAERESLKNAQLSKENALLNAKNKEMERKLETAKRRQRELRDLCDVWEKPLKERLRARNNATTSRVMEKPRENADSRDVLPKRRTRRPLADRKNGCQEDANLSDSKEEEQ